MDGINVTSVFVLLSALSLVNISLLGVGIFNLLQYRENRKRVEAYQAEQGDSASSYADDELKQNLEELKLASEELRRSVEAAERDGRDIILGIKAQLLQLQFVLNVEPDSGQVSTSMNGTTSTGDVKEIEMRKRATLSFESCVTESEGSCFVNVQFHRSTAGNISNFGFCQTPSKNYKDGDLEPGSYLVNRFCSIDVSVDSDEISLGSTLVFNENGECLCSCFGIGNIPLRTPNETMPLLSFNCHLYITKCNAVETILM